MTQELNIVFESASGLFAQCAKEGMALPKLITLRQVAECETTGAMLRQQLVIKRVKNPAPLAVKFEKDGWVQCEAKIEAWQDLAALFQDESLQAMAHWALPAIEAFSAQALKAHQASAEFVQIFMERGKWLFHGPGAAWVPPKYVPANSTMEAHVSTIHYQVETPFPQNLFIHLAAQHLDYPEDTGARRHSTSKLFDLCYAIERMIGKGTLAEAIDDYLIAAWSIAPKGREAEVEQAQSLLGGGIASLNSSPDRVRQRARFAAMMEYVLARAAGDVSSIPLNMPILQHYMKLVRLDIQFIQKQEKSFPFAQRDAMASHVHASLETVMEARYGNATA